MKSNISTLLSLGIVAILVAGCAMKPKLSVEARHDDAGVVFSFRKKNINGLLGFRVEQANNQEVLWDLNLNYYNESSLVYGRIPSHFKTFNGATGEAKQTIPAGNERPKIFPPNCRFRLTVIAQCDEALAATAKPFYFSFSSDMDGNISKLIPE